MIRTAFGSAGSTVYSPLTSLFMRMGNFSLTAGLPMGGSRFHKRFLYRTGRTSFSHLASSAFNRAASLGCLVSRSFFSPRSLETS